MSTPAEFEYDVAISFRQADLATAQQIQEHLQPALRCFVYARAQEDIAGTDGLETFRSVFRERARLSVVLYRQGWGETPWTGVEEAAIKDRCLQTRYRSLLLVNLDGSEPPAWVPDTYIHFDLQAYPMEQLIGAIKMRAQELGSQLKRPSLADKAVAIERRRVFDAETQELLDRGTVGWDEAFEGLVASIRTQAAEITARTGWRIDSGLGAVIGGFVVTTQGQAMQIESRELYTNTARLAYANLREYNARVSIQEPGRSYIPLRELRPAATTRLEIRRLPDLGWCWELNGRIRSVDATAEAILERLLERVEERRGKPPEDFD